jgi:hypothetical protein
VREWLIPGFNLKLTKGEFMVGREGDSLTVPL